MSEEIVVVGTSKQEKYSSLLPQLEALLLGESDQIANMANIVATLKETFGFFWWFLSCCNNQLILGPFQGPVACTRISFGKGVCGTA